MKNKVAVIGDLHLGVNKSSEIFFDTSLKYADWLIAECKKRKIDTIIQLGDIFHHQYVLCVGTLNAAYKFFDKLRDFNIHVIVGNHDLPKKGYVEENSLKLLSEWPNITVHEKVTSIDNVTFCGWGTKLDDIPKYQRILFGHFDIRGFQMTSTKISEHGFNASDLMDRCDLLMSGHYHKPQIRFYNKKPLIYSGSCYQLNWGESGEEKFLYFLDTETLKIEKIENTISPRFEYIRDEKDYGKIKNNFVSITSNVEDIKDKYKFLIENKALDVRTVTLKPKIDDESQETMLSDFRIVSIDEGIDEYSKLISNLDDDERKIVADIAKKLYAESI